MCRMPPHAVQSEMRVIAMKKYKELNNHERKVLRACQNGWWLSGVYEAVIDEHRRTFEADSIPMLFNDVSRWHGTHIENHADSPILVRCMRPC